MPVIASRRWPVALFCDVAAPNYGALDFPEWSLKDETPSARAVRSTGGLVSLTPPSAIHGSGRGFWLVVGVLRGAFQPSLVRHVVFQRCRIAAVPVPFLEAPLRSNLMVEGRTRLLGAVALSACRQRDGGERLLMRVQPAGFPAQLAGCPCSRACSRINSSRAHFSS